MQVQKKYELVQFSKNPQGIVYGFDEILLNENNQVVGNGFPVRFVMGKNQDNQLKLMKVMGKKSR
jgi:hypothetical protein